ncbi:MAG: sialate O-acetylesterase [Woeseiaceae bacterium]
MRQAARTSLKGMLVLSALLIVGVAQADLRLPRLLTDGVVLQRDTEVSLWGWADAGENVEVRLDGKPLASATAGDGRWSLTIGPYAAGGPHRLEFCAGDCVAIDDVWFGDVWLASGQSNMELPMVRVQDMFAADIANADYPLVRHFTVPKEYEFAGPRADLAGGAWQRATPDSVMNLSAAGYFFARSLHQRYDVPIGLIVSAYGGSAAESWMSESALEAYPHYLEIARGYQDAAYLQSLIEADQAAADAWYGGLEHADAGLAADVPWYDPVLDDSAWQAVVVPGFFTGELAGSGSVWLRRTVKLPPSVDGAAALLNLGRIKDADTVWVNGTEVGGITYEWPPRRYALEPGVLRPGANTITIRVVVNSGWRRYSP